MSDVLLAKGAHLVMVVPPFTLNAIVGHGGPGG